VDLHGVVARRLDARWRVVGEDEAVEERCALLLPDLAILLDEALLQAHLVAALLLLRRRRRRPSASSPARARVSVRGAALGMGVGELWSGVETPGGRRRENGGSNETRPAGEDRYRGRGSGEEFARRGLFRPAGRPAQLPLEKRPFC